MTQTIKINLGGDLLESKSKKSDIQVEIKRNELYVTGLPDGHSLEYVARDTATKSTFYVVHRPEKDWDYNSFRLHIGAERELREAEVLSVRRARDGGTTDIDYVLMDEIGYLHFPTPFNKEARPMNRYLNKTTSLEKLI